MMNIDYGNLIKKVGSKQAAFLMNTINKLNQNAAKVDIVQLDLDESVKDLVNLGTIDFTVDLNDPYTTGTDDINIVFVAKKPANKIIREFIFVVKEDIVSYTGITIDSVSAKGEFSLAVVGDTFPKNEESDILVNIKLSAANVGDWVTGKLDVYILVSPNLITYE